MLYGLLICHTGYDTHAKVDAMDWDQVADVLTSWRKYPPAAIALDSLISLVHAALGGSDG